MRTRAEDSRVSEIQDSRKMMSSEQTETEVFGLFPKKQHPPTRPTPASLSFTIFASSSLIKCRGEKKLFFFGTELHHIISSAVLTLHNRKRRCETLPRSVFVKAKSVVSYIVEWKSNHSRMIQINPTTLKCYLTRQKSFKTTIFPKKCLLSVLCETPQQLASTCCLMLPISFVYLHKALERLTSRTILRAKGQREVIS